MKIEDVVLAIAALSNEDLQQLEGYLQATILPWRQFHDCYSRGSIWEDMHNFERRRAVISPVGETPSGTYGYEYTVYAYQDARGHRPGGTGLKPNLQEAMAEADRIMKRQGLTLLDDQDLTRIRRGPSREQLLLGED